MGNDLIAYCGLDCEKCDARIATLTNNDALREETAKKWAEMNNSPEITPATINCHGCRTEGLKFGWCSMCEIRACAAGKGLPTCGKCPELDTCTTIAPLLQNVIEARTNLMLY